MQLLIIVIEYTGGSLQILHLTQSSTGNSMPTARHTIQFPNKTKHAQHGGANAVTFHQTRNEEEDPYTLPGDPDDNDDREEDPYTLPEDDEDEDPYTLPVDPDEGDEDPYTLLEPVEVTAPQNTTPTCENLTQTNDAIRPPIACSENQLETGSSNTLKVSGTNLHGECTFSMQHILRS